MLKSSSTIALPTTQKRFFGLQWHVTNTCDQCCQHCYIWGKNPIDVEVQRSQKELNLVQCTIIVDDFLRFCNDFKVQPAIVITGGDPLLYKNIWGLLEYIHSKNLTFSILGNPFHLTDEICIKLRSLGCRSYQMSLDGLEETHDFLRKPGSFQNTLESLPKLKRAGIKTAIMSTVSRMNYSEIPELVRMVSKYEVPRYSFGRYCPIGKETDESLMMEPLEYKTFLSDMFDVYSELRNRKTHFTLKDHLWKLFLYERGLFSVQKGSIVMQGCACGIKHLTLLPDGIIYACRRFESPVGNILNQSFRDIFLSEELGKYRKVDMLEGCSDCELLNYCRGCHAVAHGLTGNFFSKDPQCWKDKTTI
ncbi:MAG: radical SAM/SPASM domain protein, ACGX system [Patescibacteria group bacterium]|nr:radical SAM/SPASM domain protein, ACGX system [Patescibacteria group bacterium]